MSAGIYKLTNKINGKCYVGQSINLEKRIKMYEYGHCKGQTKIFNALKKYGFDNFKIEYLFQTSEKEKHLIFFLNQLEIYYIKKFDCIKNGYNLKDGGLNGRFSDESKKKISLAVSGKNNGMYGKKYNHTDETKLKISLKHKGKKQSDERKKQNSECHKGIKHTDETKLKIGISSKGRKHTDETKLKISIAQKKIIRKPLSDETKIKMSDSAKGKPKLYLIGKKLTKEHTEKISNANSICILQFTLDNIFLSEWKSASEAGRKLNIDSSSISKCCNPNNKVNSTGGFKWKYK